MRAMPLSIMETIEITIEDKGTDVDSKQPMVEKKNENWKAKVHKEREKKKRRSGIELEDEKWVY